MFDSSRYQSGCDPISIWYDVINARLFFKPKFRFFFCVWVKLSVLSYLKQTESSKRNLKYDVFVFCFGCCSMHCTLQLFTWKYPHKARHGSILIAAAAITSSCFGWLFFPLENKNPLTWELHSCSFSLNFFFSLSFLVLVEQRHRQVSTREKVDIIQYIYNILARSNGRLDQVLYFSHYKQTMQRL